MPGIAILCPNPSINLKKSGSDTMILCAAKNPVTILIAEIFATWVFISVIMSVIYFHNATGPVKALAVGGTLYGMATTAGKVSGGCLNPAVGLA